MGNTCTSARSGPRAAAGADPSSLNPAGPRCASGGAIAIAATKSSRETIEQQQQREREAGQQQLREIVAVADREGMALDWSALIKKAEELHRRDQELERKRRRMMHKSRSEDRGYRKRLRRKRQWKSNGGSGASDGTGGCSSGGTGGVGGVSARFQQNMERRRRRRAEACGSFSVNLTVYRNETELPLLHNDPSFEDKLGLLDVDPAGGSQAGTSTAASLEDTAPGLSSVDEETGCAGSLDSSLALSDGFHVGTSFGEELETIQE